MDTCMLKRDILNVCQWRIQRWITKFQQALGLLCQIGIFMETKFPITVFSQFSCSVMSNSVTQWTAPCQASQSITNSQSLFKLMSVESVMPTNHLNLCYPLPLLPSNFPTVLDIYIIGKENKNS